MWRAQFLEGPLQARVSSVAELGEQFRALAAEAVDEMRKGGELHVRILSSLMRCPRGRRGSCAPCTCG